MDDLLENNKLIAEFMGFTHVDNNDDKIWYQVPDKVELNYEFSYGSDVSYTTPDMLPYNLSYDWLMPVVEKISSLTTEDNYNFNFYKVLSLNIDASLNHIYEAVVEFIKWYNKNNKK